MTRAQRDRGGKRPRSMIGCFIDDSGCVIEILVRLIWLMMELIISGVERAWWVAVVVIGRLIVGYSHGVMQDRVKEQRRRRGMF